MKLFFCVFSSSILIVSGAKEENLIAMWFYCWFFPVFDNVESGHSHKMPSKCTQKQQQ